MGRKKKKKCTVQGFPSFYSKSPNERSKIYTEGRGGEVLTKTYLIPLDEFKLMRDGEAKREKMISMLKDYGLNNLCDEWGISRDSIYHHCRKLGLANPTQISDGKTPKLRKPPTLKVKTNGESRELNSKKSSNKEEPIGRNKTSNTKGLTMSFVEEGSGKEVQEVVESLLVGLLDDRTYTVSVNIEEQK